MAKRESQGLLVAVILLVFFALLMCVFTYYFWSQSSRLHLELEAAENSMQDTNRVSGQRSLENQKLKEMLGLAPDEKIEAIEKQHTDDMNLFGESIPAENRNYHELPIYLVNAVRALGSKLDQANQTELQLKKEKQRALAEEQARTKQAEDQLNKVSADMEGERAKFMEDRQAWKSRMDELQDEIKKSTRDAATKEEELATRIRQQTEEIKGLALNNGNLARQLEEFKDQSFETPDGQIAWVNQKSRTAQLNLGRADGLQRQITFSVFDADENKLATAKKKGSVEVTRVLDDHRSEARIVDDDYTNPIITGDVVYSPLWQPGMSMRFALAGLMDIDGDGLSDRKLIKNLITLNGGIVVAEVADDGNRDGELSIHTRYLVLGERPRITQNVAAGATGALVEEYGRIIREAEQFGVQQLPVERLISDLGYRGSAKTVALGKNAKEQDFIRSPTNSNNRFRPRSPPRRRGAY